MVRRGGHHCPHYRKKSSEPRERSAALFFCPCCRKAASKRGRPAPEAHPAPGTPSRPRLLAAGRGRGEEVARATMRGAARPAPAVVAASAAARLAAAVRRPRNPAPALNAAAGPCGAAVRALAPPVKKARPSPSGAARPCLFSGAAAPRSFPAYVLGGAKRPRRVVAVLRPLGPKRPARLRPAGGRAVRRCGAAI